MKVLLLGKSGMLGSSFMEGFSAMEGLELFACGRKELDVEDFGAVEVFCRRVHPDLVINCVAMADVDACESERDLAMRLNAEVPELLAKECEKAGSGLIHFSTDYVFGGETAVGYEEEDETSPINFYGESKLAGEKAVRENLKSHFIVRTSVLFGGARDNFVSKIIKAAEENDELSVVTDQIACPTYAHDLANGVIERFISEKQQSGIYHLTNEGATSRFELASEAIKLMERDVKVLPASLDNSKRPARRPKNTTLLNTKLKPLRSWQEALKVYLNLNFKK